MSEQPKLREMWSLRNRRRMGEQRNLADRIYTLFIYVTAVILAINGLMVIGLHPVAATLILLIFGYVAWSLMIRLRRDQRRQ